MNSRLLVFISFLFFEKFCIAQTKFQRAYGDSLNEYSFSAQQTNDKGFLLAGYTNSYGAGQNNFYLIKTDSLANAIWSKIYAGTYDDEAYSVEQTIDGGYIIAGYTRSFGIQYYDAFLIKTDANGDTLWSKTYGGLGSQYANSVTQTSDGGYAFAGYTIKTTIAGDSGSIYVVKTSPQGNLLWQKVLGAGNQISDGYSIKQTTDKGYVITGYTNGFGEINGDAFLIKTDSLANPVFTKTYGFKGADWGNSIQQTSDGGYVIGGSYSKDSSSTDIDAYIIKTDANGDTLWTRTFGGTGFDYGQSIQQTSDGGYVLGGYSNSFGAGSYDAFLVKINTNGDTLFSRVFGGTDDDEANAVFQTSDGGYVLTGQTASFGKGNYDFYVVRTDGIGNSSCHQTNVHASEIKPNTRVSNETTLQNSVPFVQQNATPMVYSGITITDVCSPLGILSYEVKNTEMGVFPNPNNGTFWLLVDTASRENIAVTIENTMGEIVYTCVTNPSREISIEHLVSGTYFIKTQLHNKVSAQKIILIK